MTARLSRQQWFTVFLLCALAGHLALYRGAGASLQPEWPLIFDLLFTFPLAYALICRPGWQEFLKKWASLVLLGMAFGSLAIPDTSKQLWLAIDRFRLLVPGLFAVVELAIAIAVIYGLRRALTAGAHADRVLARMVQRCFGDGSTARLMEFEARIWYYGLFMRRRPAFDGQQHFFTSQAGGNASNQLAWIWLMVLDIPIAHLLLHFLWSPTAAWIATALTAWGLLYLVADYRATLARPVSLDSEGMHVRCGALAADAFIPYAMIESVARVPHPARRLKGKRYFRHQGEMNVEITLRSGAVLPTLLGGARPASHAVLGVDEPSQLVEALKARLT